MKNLWKLLSTLILLAIISTSCNMELRLNPWNIELDNSPESKNLEVALANDYFTLKRRIGFIQEYINNKVEYYADTSLPWNIQFPQETLNKKLGDCKNKSMLLIGLCYKYLNIKCIYVGERDIDKLIGHAFVQYKDYYYDSTSTIRKKVSDTSFNIVININFDDLADYILCNNATWY